MPDFLRLTTGEQSDILTVISARTGRSAHVLQKDVWVCWVLRELFSIDAGVRMAFKGGTSLSKVFGLIHRFSEDVDVTLDYRDLLPDTNPFEAGISKSQVKRLGNRLKDKVEVFVRDRILPTLSLSFSDLIGGEGRIEMSQDGEKVWLHYPSSLDCTLDYIQDTVLLEFGGRNVTEPNEPYTIKPFLADEVPELEYPSARVMVLAPQRTFWEKATLIHVACNRQRTGGVNRLSRHWYDLVMLGQSEIGSEAMSNRVLLQDVVAHKQLFFNASYAHYEDCLSGRFRLVPDPAHLSEWKQDYEEMIAAGMFEVAPPTFAKIVDTLKSYEDHINRNGRRT